MTDEQLLAAFMAGDQAAFTELVERYQGPVTRYVAAKGVKDPSDTVQSVFIYISENASRFIPGKCFKPWLYEVANELAQERRASDRRAGKWQETPEAEVLAETYQR